MPWARASSLHRFLACPAASWLPRWDDGSGRTARGYLTGDVPTPAHPQLLEIRSKAAAERGRRAHAAKERGELFPELWKGMHDLGVHELSFSYCCKTGAVRTLQHSNERARTIWKALQCEHSVVGTADWVSRLGGRVWVDDLKTGWGPQEVLTPQLMFYAMCWSQWMQCDGALLSVCHYPSAKGVPTREGLWRRVSALDLELFRLELHTAYERVRQDRKPRPGAHCVYCPSAAWCPAAPI